MNSIIREDQQRIKKKKTHWNHMFKILLNSFKNLFSKWTITNWLINNKINIFQLF